MLDASPVSRHSEVVSVSKFGGDAINLVFRVDGKVAERLVYRGEETGFEFVSAGRAYAFDADGGLLRLASEAYRIRLAHLFDPYLAISASQIEALPHQITAVYGEMLPRQPLRFLLADDPGAGKTIMAGLLIKELLIRGNLERCMIVAPGSLVEVRDGGQAVIGNIKHGGRIKMDKAAIICKLHEITDHYLLGAGTWPADREFLPTFFKTVRDLV